MSLSLEDYLEALREGELSDPGEFTVAIDRARTLLGEKLLVDPWWAWLCIAQGLIASGSESLEVSVSRYAVVWQTDFRRPATLGGLIRQERFLLGWLNLGWFGRPTWDSEAGTLTVEWKGNAWQRYRLATSMESQLVRGLLYSHVPVKVGRSMVVRQHLPADCPLTLFTLCDQRPGGLVFADGGPPTKGAFEPRRFGLEELGPSWAGPAHEGRLGAFASKSKLSWSTVTWVHHGVVISQERNVIDRAGLMVVASVEALGLETDLAGFSVINNEAYFRFTTCLKRDVLWML